MNVLFYVLGASGIIGLGLLLLMKIHSSRKFVRMKQTPTSTFEDQGAMWQSVLQFLSLELFGPEVMDLVGKFEFKGSQKAKEEKVIKVTLDSWERNLFILSEAGMFIGEHQNDNLLVYRAEAVSRSASAL